MSDLQRRFGLLVAAHRRRQKLTQEALAERAGLSVDMITRVEGGNTGASFASIERLAEALEVDPAELFSSDIPKGALQRRALTAVTARIAGLPDRDLAWVGDLLDVALKRRS